jgi:hypothetical protein
MNERKLPGLPFDFPSGSRQGSANGRPRPLLGLQWCDLHSRAYGTEHASLGKRARAELTQRPRRHPLHCRRSVGLGSGTLRPFFPAARRATPVAYRRSLRQPTPQARGDGSCYRRGHCDPSVSIV